MVLRKSTGCATAWRISPALAEQMEARAHAKIRNSSVEARPSARFRESTRSQIVVVRRGSGALQYLAVSGRSEENIYCDFLFVPFALSCPLPVSVVRVTSVSFPSLRKVGDSYFKGLD